MDGYINFTVQKEGYYTVEFWSPSVLLFSSLLTKGYIPVLMLSIGMIAYSMVIRYSPLFLTLSFIAAYLMRFIIAANLLGLPAITVPVSSIQLSMYHDILLYYLCLLIGYTIGIVSHRHLAH